MHTDPAIFKAYDIRGIYGTQLTNETGYRLGRAFGMYLKEQYPNEETLQVVVGRDMRESGVPIEAELKRGLAEEGVEIINIDLSSTPMMYYATLEYGTHGGIIITASHNPAEYNGFKLVSKGAVPISGETGVYQMRDMVMDDQLMSPRETTLELQESYRPDTLSQYIQNVLSYRDTDTEIRPMKIVVDSANGMASPAIEELFRHFPQVEMIHLFPELDGNFPNHEANPLKEETLEALKTKVADTRADFGVACDGDFDRVSFVDNAGRTIRPDITTALLAPVLLQGREGSKILYDLRSSNITPEVIQEHGGIAIQTRVGHSFIKAQMAKEKAFFSGEFSGHFYLDVEHQGNHAYFENPLFVVVKIMELLSNTDATLADCTAHLFKYVHSGEINFEIERPKEEILSAIKAELSEGSLSELDGIRIDLADAWVSVRASNTEPVLRLIVEGKTEEDMVKLRDRVISIITE